ncbi:DNA-binding transcriptional regulator, LacI/PurR family [Nakamurella panacisegetis]|uniref:DNA-binding transcriptional regulator, LacI/PurR family n=1 Tax=Nakamurella panacisegetis TaxID=1090615 RepID=A0A1H0QTG1_9ACTN|nr:LacI family DNA-binding transcriptional regulator [Nakamurella panacisegetis]SDP20405.1 DNA-binding transcriptional regulator, LacI/PurR family [Nakamurella panacisegetis]
MPRHVARPSLATVAVRVGVSTATVSNSFNRPEKVSDTVRSKVLAEAARQGYAGPDPAARQLSRGGRTDTLGLLLTEELPLAFTDPAAVAFLQGLAASCQGAGQNLLLISATSNSDASDAVRAAVVDGFVVYAVRADDPHLQRILDRRLPTVLVDTPAPTDAVDWVGPDDRAGARELAEVLIEQGHRRIGAITAGLRGARYSGPAEHRSSADLPASIHGSRIQGLRDALGAAGLDDLPIEERPENTHAAGADALHALMDRRPDLTAVCVLMDVMAIGALAAARDRGLDIPGDLTVTGYDDIPQAAAAGLTTVSQPLTDKGRIAGELYLSRRAGGPSRRRVLPTHVKVRSSSGPPRC